MEDQLRAPQQAVHGALMFRRSGSSPRHWLALGGAGTRYAFIRRGSLVGFRSSSEGS